LLFFSHTWHEKKALVYIKPECTGMRSIAKYQSSEPLSNGAAA
jgi:hypothetical protein